MRDTEISDCFIILLIEIIHHLVNADEIIMIHSVHSVDGGDGVRDGEHTPKSSALVDGGDGRQDAMWVTRRVRHINFLPH